MISARGLLLFLFFWTVGARVPPLPMLPPADMPPAFAAAMSCREASSEDPTALDDALHTVSLARSALSRRAGGDRPAPALNAAAHPLPAAVSPSLLQPGPPAFAILHTGGALFSPRAPPAFP